MKAIKNGIRTTLRTPKKTVLFAAILLLLAALISVAFSIFAAVRCYRDDCEAYFHTVVNLEYVGKYYPSGMTYDETLADALRAHRAELDALCRSEQVLSFEPVSNSLALVDGLHRKDRLSYDAEAAVLQVYVTGIDEEKDYYNTIIEKSLYARTDESGKILCLRVPYAEDPSARRPEKGMHYLICGHFYQGQSSYLWFQAEDMTCLDDDGNAVSVPACTQTEAAQGPAGSAYETLAACLERNNNSCPVQYTSALEDQLPFHQQALTMAEGRVFTAEEYAENAGVCVISSRLAAVMELACGDRLTLSVWETEGDLYRLPPTDLRTEQYEIVGVYSRNDDYPYEIYLPVQDAEGAGLRAVNGCRLGQFRIENTGAAAFLEQAQPLEQSGFRFTVYDQGYAVAVESTEDLLLLSDVFLLICLVLTISVLCLQCHLFISRQRETAQTMLALGSGKGYIHRYFLGGTALLAIPATLLGCVLGKLLERAVLSLLGYLSETLFAQDIRFSASGLSLVRTLDFAPKIPAWVYLAAGGFLLLCAALLTLLFGAGALKDRAERKRRRRLTPRIPKARRSSHLRCRLKYALLSIRRNTGRTAAVLALSVVIALFFGYLTDSLHGYHAELEDMKARTVLTGHATDSLGQRIDGLVVNAKHARAFLAEDLVSDFNLTNTICHLRFIGIPEKADGSRQTVPAPALPETGHAIETLFGKMYHEPLWVQTSSVSGLPLFYAAPPTEIRWLEGYGEECMLGTEWCCALPRTMMEEKGIALGDTCRFLYAIWNDDDPAIDTIDMKVVCSYVSASESDTIYSPIGNAFLKCERTFNGSVLLTDGSYDSFVFTIRDVNRLPAVRDALEASGFTYVRSGERLRTYVIIDDEVYQNTAHSMERQIKYVTTLYVCLYLIAGVLGYVLSRLMTASRKRELALMRALGTQPRRIVANFHAEQTVLCAFGLLLGVGIWLLTGNRVDPAQLILTAAYFVIWSGTALLCLLRGMKNPAYNDLTEPE